MHPKFRPFFLKSKDLKIAVGEWLSESLIRYATTSKWYWQDEDSACAHFLSSIAGRIEGNGQSFEIAGYKLRGRGRGAAESILGADGIGIVRVKTTDTDLTAYFLFQAKKCNLNKENLSNAHSECARMLSHTAASQLLVLTRKTVYLSGALAVASLRISNPSLNHIPHVNFGVFVRDQVLKGLMLEPLGADLSAKCSALADEIKYIITIIGSEEKWEEDVRREVESTLADLGLSEAEIIAHSSGTSLPDEPPPEDSPGRSPPDEPPSEHSAGTN